jgi:hypothetical protein
LLAEEGYNVKNCNINKLINLGSDSDNLDENQFSKIDEDLQREVARIMARLKKARRKRKMEKNDVRKKLEELKELYDN